MSVLELVALLVEQSEAPFQEGVAAIAIANRRYVNV